MRDLRNARAVVTGGAGFLGSHAVDALLARGANVTIFDAFTEGARENTNSRAKLIDGDIRNPADARKALDGADFVLHFAAIASVPRCTEVPAEAYDVNVAGTVTLLETLRRSRSQATFLLSSSASVYGRSATPRLFSETAPTAPVSTYAASKCSAELIVEDYTRSFGIDGRVVRFTNVYGPRQPRYILFDMYNKVLAATDRLQVLGSGRQQRDFCYCSDAIAGALAVLACANPAHRTFNISGMRPVTVMQFAQAVAAAMGKPNLKIETAGDTWLGDVDYILADSARIRELCPPPVVDLDEGIKAFVDWMRRRAIT
jgi:UDP-glucose 4-epimerase